MLYFEKSQPAPDCLEKEKQKSSSNYNCDCVLDRIKEDFKNKCYICERKDIADINIEHFKPHRGDKNLKFDWNNLFLCCGHCNNTKLDKFDNILNCTDKNDAIENQLKYEIKPYPHELVRIEALSNDDKVINTKDLLLAVFNGTTKHKISEAYNLRKQLIKELRNYLDDIFEYEELLECAEKHFDDDKEYLLRKIKKHLSSASAFTSFKRQIIKDNEKLFANFGVYF